LGLTGGADTTIILKRARYEQEGTLAITGRDVEEQELAATFHKDSGLWVITKQNAKQLEQLTKAKREIIDVMREKGAMTPGQIAKELKKAGSTVRTLLAEMVKDKLLCKKVADSTNLLLTSKLMLNKRNCLRRKQTSSFVIRKSNAVGLPRRVVLFGGYPFFPTTDNGSSCGL
ncbi:MAG TPA: hypothetical protein VF458_02505, partial [Ktedonobacteraceae bacterium]